MKKNHPKKKWAGKYPSFPAPSACWSICSSPFHNPDLLFCQPVKLLDQGAYMPVGGLDLALKERLLVTIFGYMAQEIDLYKQTH